LRSIEGSTFFQMLRAHTIEGDVLRPHARRQRRVDRLATDRIPGPANVIPRRN
jgi:hypothetical protein